MSPPLRKAEWAAAAVLTLGILWLHFMAAASGGALWRDEANTVGLATLPALGDVWRNLQYDSFPMLWLLIVREISAVAGPMNDSAFRAFGLCVGVGIVGAIWFHARTLRHPLPLLSLALLGMSPVLIRWGDSMRGYGFGLLLILLTGSFLWRFVKEPGAGRFAAAAVLALASVHVLFYNAILLLAFCAGAVAVCLEERAWKKAGLIVLIGALSAISMVPYAVPLREATSWNVLVQVEDYSVRLFWTKLAETLRAGGQWAVAGWVAAFLLALICGVAAVASPGRFGLSKEQRQVSLFSLVTLVAGVVGIFLFLHALSYVTAPWYYLALLALAAVCIDALFGAVIHSPAARVARLLGVLVFAGATLLPALRAARTRLTDVDLVASRIGAIAQSHDVVVVNPWYYGVGFQRYYHGAAGWMTVPPIGFHRFHRYDLVKDEMTVTDQTMPVRPIIDRLAEALSTGHRVYVVGALPVPQAGHRPTVLPPAPLRGPTWPLDETSYLDQWGSIVGYFLQQHSTTVASLPVKKPGVVSSFENVFSASD